MCNMSGDVPILVLHFFLHSLMLRNNELFMSSILNSHLMKNHLK